MTTPPSAFLQSELTISLAVLAPKLVASGVSADVSSALVKQSLPVFQRNTVSEWARGILGGVCSVYIRLGRLWCILYKVSAEKARRGGSAGTSDDLAAEIRPQWMPAIRLKKRRSKSRDMVNDV